MPMMVQHYLPYIVIFNFGLVASILIGLAAIVKRQKLEEVPGLLQNAAEYSLEWFVRLARSMRPDAVTVIAPFLASLFLFILCSNLLAVLAIPIIQIPPTAYYSGPLTLAVLAMAGITVISVKLRGIRGAVEHLFWPNPLQLVSKISDILSLSLRLFGNIGGEFLVSLLVIKAAPFGIPLIIHLLGLIPAFIQPLVFTLLTSNFLAEAIHAEKEKTDEGTPAAEAGASPPEGVREL